LIELLVVMAIIAVLASLVLAALPGIRERGRRTVCRNNLHQMAVAMNLYGIDHQDWLPSGQFTNDDRRPIYLPLLSMTAQQAFVTYARSSNYLDCPNLRQFFVRSNDWRRPFDRNHQQIGYFYLAGRPRTPWEPSGGPVSNTWTSPVRLSDPSHLIVFADLNYVAPCVGRMVSAHGRTGPMVETLSNPTAELGAYTRPVERRMAGTDVARLDGSVEWRGAKLMQWFRGALEGSSDNSTCMAAW
jgi:type II secretory pathway pseudopilin PulG